MAHRTFVIVGAGLAGAKAAETLRAEGFDGRVVLIGDERERPYERPPLSKEYLRGETSEKPYVHDAGFYESQSIELRTSTAVEAIDPASARVTLADGERLPFDRLLIATGAEPRRLQGADGVRTLRTVADSDAIRARLDAGGHVVIVGAGWIGAEVAASARSRGCEVTLLELAPVPLERVLGPELGAFYRDVHADHGVTFVGGAQIEAVAPDGVRLAGGRRIDADLVLAGVGVQPRDELARRAGLLVENGIAVDERLETSAPGIFAAGDVANALHPFYGERLRVEHWHNALEQGAAAARSMLGSRDPYERLPYFFSDQYDVGMEYAGFARSWDQVVLRGDPVTREFIAFWLAGDRVVAGMNVNVWDVTDTIQRLIRTRTPVDARRLADPEVPLEELAPAQASS